jgi:hypothetical protein
MTANTVTTYVVEALLNDGEWHEASVPQPDLQDARRIVRQATEANVGNRLRVVERRVTTVREVMP